MARSYPKEGMYPKAQSSPRRNVSLEEAMERSVEAIEQNFKLIDKLDPDVDAQPQRDNVNNQIRSTYEVRNRTQKTAPGLNPSSCKLHPDASAQQLKRNDLENLIRSTHDIRNRTHQTASSLDQSSSRSVRQLYKHTDRRNSHENVFRFDEGFTEYEHVVVVEFKATFLKINDIDTLSQQFEAEGFLQAKWEELAFLGMDPRELELLLPGDLWDPHLAILNVAGEFDQERRSYVVRYEEGYEAPVVLHRWRFKGLFREPLELRYFPFDVQDLSLHVSTERSIDEVKMKHDPCQLSSVNTRTFQDSQEWSIYKHVECTHKTTSIEYASSTIHPILVFSCRVRRKVGYFLWNIIFIVFLVLSLSFFTISVEPTTSDRLANTITLFLTLVAFKLVVKQSLPTISYLTYLDIYVLGSLLYLVLFALENSAMASLGRWTDRALVEAYDELFCMMLAALLVFGHLVFIIHIQVTALKRHRQMQENDRQYELQAQALMKKQEERRRQERQNSLGVKRHYKT